MQADKDVDLFLDVADFLTVITRAPEPLGIGLSKRQMRHTDFEKVNARRLVSNALKTHFGNLNVSLFEGKVYFYDACTEMLRILAVEKARERRENYGLFFQSREAIAKLHAMDAELHRKLRQKWYVVHSHEHIYPYRRLSAQCSLACPTRCDRYIPLTYYYTLRQALATIIIQKMVRH